MPWKGVTVTEERQRFIEDHKLRYYSVSELADRFGISRRTAYESKKQTAITDDSTPKVSSKHSENSTSIMA